MSELSDDRAPASCITHELLLLARDVVEDVCDTDAGDRDPPSTRSKLKLLTKLIARAVGGTVANDAELHLKVGKRLERQASEVSSALAELDAMDEAAGAPDVQARELQLTEIYVGFHELASVPGPAEPSTDAASTRSFTSEQREQMREDARWLGVLPEGYEEGWEACSKQLGEGYERDIRILRGGYEAAQAKLREAEKVAVRGQTALG